MKTIPPIAVLTLVLALAAGPPLAADDGDAAWQAWCEELPDCPQCPLPRPSAVGAFVFSEKFKEFVDNKACWESWTHDKADWRTTGPYVASGPTGSGSNYGTHAPFIRIYYSPGVYEWLRDGRQGPIGDGEMVLKLQCSRDSDDLTQVDCKGQSWANMVKDSQGSYDGWFWSDGADFAFSRDYPTSAFGLYCLNCHATVDNTESTYSSLVNIDTDGTTYYTLIPTMANQQYRDFLAGLMPPVESIHARARQEIAALRAAPAAEVQPVSATAAPSWMTMGHTVPVAEPMIRMPITGFDHVPQSCDPEVDPERCGGLRSFLTSDNCIGCHDATQNNSALPNMTLQEVKTFKEKDDATLTQSVTQINLSQYSEWRYSNMGLGGRDPVFFAQVETERAIHPEVADEIDNLCLHCHGSMGQRQFQDDHGNRALFTHEMVLDLPQWAADAAQCSDGSACPASGECPDGAACLWADYLGENPYGANQPQNAVYASLARDGISCMICHRILEKGLGEWVTYTGFFNLAEVPDEIYGPYQDDNIVTLPMKNALGITPTYDDGQIKDSDLCGSCHSVFTPKFEVDQKASPQVFYKYENDPVFRVNAAQDRDVTFHEQTTYFEWLNSVYADTGDPEARTCQECHLPSDWFGADGNLAFRIANSEDDTFPDIDTRAPADEIELRTRSGGVGDEGANGRFARHALHGINPFTTAMFTLGPDDPKYLGVPPNDPMNFSQIDGVKLSIDNAIYYAQRQTADLAITGAQRTATGIRAEVTVTNETGHKFPSGVGFRRAFLELEVTVNDVGKWRSGGTDEWGVIVDGDGKPLETEFFCGPPGSGGKPDCYQRHYDQDHPITRQDQVQIYEELVHDSQGVFTTSFLSLWEAVKDNRLMPKGWTSDGPEADETEPVGRAADDSTYLDGSGSSVVRYEIPLQLGDSDEVKVTATLYYQAMPPYYLAQRFHLLADPENAPATQSLFYYILNLDPGSISSAMEDWKLEMVSAREAL